MRKKRSISAASAIPRFIDNTVDICEVQGEAANRLTIKGHPVLHRMGKKVLVAHTPAVLLRMTSK